MKQSKVSKFVRRLFSTALACIVALSVAACAKTEDVDEKTSYDGTDGTGLSNGAVEQTNANKVVQTTKIMAENGTTEYTVVLPVQLGDHDETAYNELSNFLRSSVGVNIACVADTGLTFDESKKYISLGKTTLLTQAGITVNEEELGVTGYVIKTVGNSVFICGGGSRGTLFGVYEFLQHSIGYEYYAEDEIAYDNLTKLYLFDFDVKTIPSFEYCYLSSSIYSGVPNGSNRYRITSPFIIPYGGVHSSFVYIDKATYNDPNKTETYHPEFYARNESGTQLNQLCYSADGLVDAMVAEFIPYLEESYLPENYKEEQIYFHIGQEDYWDWCRCEDCKASKETYGTDAGVLVKFINQVAEKIEIWVDENQPGREVKISTFAYMSTEKPPVQYDENGNLLRDDNGDPIPIDESMRLRDNVVVRLAPIDANWYESFAAESNLTTQNVLEGWHELGECIVWLYSIGFSSQYAPFNNFNSLQETYRYVKDELQSKLCQDQYLSQGKGYPCFNAYRAYLQSNLMWNVNADQEKLTKNFFKNYYRDAADIMLQYLDELRVLYMDNWREVGLMGDCNTVNLYLPELWPRGTLFKWLGDFESAKAAVEKYAQTDPVLYEKLIDRITMESLSVRYLIIRLYGDTAYTERELYEEKVAFYNLVVKYDMWPRNAGYTFEDLKSELGI